MQKTRPRFSVIIPSVNGLPIIAECLSAVEGQVCDFDFEIIVVDRLGENTSAFIRENFPRINLVKADKSCGIPQMRAMAFEKARGDFIVIIEDHCIAPENWLNKLSCSHNSGCEVIGGAVENACAERLIDRAVFLCEYSNFMPPLNPGEVQFVTGNNTSYKRSVLENLDPDVLENCWEYFWQRELKRNGVKFQSLSDLVIIHKKSFGLIYFLGQRFHYSRSFAAMRKLRSTGFEQLFHIVYTPLLPFHQIWRIAKNIREKHYSYLEFVLTLPLLFLFMTNYAFGEFIGQIFGAGDSLSKVE